MTVFICKLNAHRLLLHRSINCTEWLRENETGICIFRIPSHTDDPRSDSKTLNQVNGV